MPINKNSITGIVAQLVTDEDLIINKGSDDGVSEKMLFEILDPRTQEVYDPDTGELLGSFDRVLATVEVTDVRPRMSMAHLASSRGFMLSDTARIVSGYRGPATLTSNTWPEGIKESHPVRYTGRLRVRATTPPKSE